MTSTGELLAVSALVLGAPCLLISSLQLNAQMLSLVARQYEFWVGTFLNFVVLVLLGLVLENARAVSAVLMWGMTQLLLLLDANFRTVQVDVRFSWLWLPAIVSIGVLCVKSARAGNVATMWETMLFNVAATLFILVVKRTYQRRVLLQRLWSFDTTIPCSSRASLKLVPFTTVKQTPQLNPKQLMVELPNEGAPLQAQCSIAPTLSPDRMLSRWWIIFLYANGIIGLTLAPASLLLVVVDYINADVLYHRQLLALLLRSFDFWFPSLQFLTASVCLADLLQWDYRCLNIIAWNLYFHFVLFVDALSPSARHCFQFRKVFVFPVPVAVLIGIVFLTYALLTLEDAVLQSRTIPLGTIQGFPLVIRTTSFMAYRLFTIFLWTMRLAYNLWYTEDHELLLLRAFKLPAPHMFKR
ncbi:TPA: hypothetical protein N0F65_010270 [Lagenidium giganteum]|uniref:Uncharacterized protein n=1 Tax=Lagenidium giganteum TaxID=4803 RepID=A0AAV2YR52_9STRA|nr:TPA: hypothetical protein N0F65_010270 [Lagenidium giganteum]